MAVVKDFLFKSFNEWNKKGQGLFRSKDMVYASIAMQSEVAPQVVKALGEYGRFHVTDLGDRERPTPTALTYKRRVADCTFWERKLAALEDVMKEYGVVVPEDVIPAEIQTNGDLLLELKYALDPIEGQLDEGKRFQNQNSKEITEFIERRHVAMYKPALTLPEGESTGYSDELSHLFAESKADEKGDQDRLNTVITGVLPTSARVNFQRMVFRATRGNALIDFQDISEPIVDQVTGQKVQKTVFLLVIIGRRVVEKVRRICQAFEAVPYAVPSQPQQRRELAELLSRNILIKQGVGKKSREVLVAELARFAETHGTSPIRNWLTAVRKERAVASVMMMCHFQPSSAIVQMEGWLLSEEQKELEICVQNATPAPGSVVLRIEPHETIRKPHSPPTAFATNMFLETYQGIVDTYGVPRYKEVNPGLFTVITFPFLFGVMYGDIGHGTLMTLFAIFLLVKESHFLQQVKAKKVGEIFSMAFGGRYVILMMGLFGMYCGFIYNDCFSMPLRIFPAAYELDHSNGVFYRKGDAVYTLGMDPNWIGSKQEMAVLNSFKMKLSVTLGVSQMLMGVVLSLCNHLYFQDYLSVFFEFIPRLIFLMATFGYMIILIIIKLSTDWSQGGDPPNLIQTMISMFLSPGNVEPSKQLYKGQGGFQAFLVLIAFLAVPMMLLPKPLIHRARHNKLKAAHQHIQAHSGVEHATVEMQEHKELVAAAPAAGGHGGGHGHGEEFNFGDEMIHMGIHTIEYVLGTVSNTASYLRLWALSLAHERLSYVFWDKLLTQYGISTGNPIMVFVGFSVWFGATFAVLLCMDVLECFLHALRLHWVEFQNKFFNADGYAFAPFSLAEAAETAAK